MTVLLAALLLAAAAAVPTTHDVDRQRPPPERATPDARPGKRTPIVAPAVADVLARGGPVIEIIVVGDAEDGAAGGTNVLEMGTVSYRPHTNSASQTSGRRSYPVTIQRRVVTVRIGTDRNGFAPLRAFLQGGDGRCRIRVDGKTLTAVPQVIDPLAPLGQPVSHVIEIEIPTTAAEGPVSASIGWTSDAH
jgi:hypothetical protein